MVTTKEIIKVVCVYRHILFRKKDFVPFYNYASTSQMFAYTGTRSQFRLSSHRKYPHRDFSCDNASVGG